MPYSRFKCFFKPADTARLIDSLSADNDSLRTDNSRLAGELDACRVSVMTSREEALILSRRLENAEKEIGERNSQLAELTLKLEEATVEKEELDEIDRLITEFEKQKADYEKRLATLRQQLRDARQAVRNLTPMEFDDNPRPVEIKSDILDPPSSSASDWLQSLPE